MKERPILFKGPMVRALLEGRKTQTRRVVMPHPVQSPTTKTWFWLKKPDIHTAWSSVPFKGTLDAYCPFGRVGDRLWVRETWYNDLPGEKNPEHVYFRADGECCQQIPECQCATVGKVKWRPSIFMLRWACRIVLEVVSVRVERVRMISEEDAVAEGVDYYTPGPKGMLNNRVQEMPSEAFRDLWDSINAKRGAGWDKNPWVWVVEFKKVEVLP
jgi:hypothetical protein